MMGLVKAVEIEMTDMTCGQCGIVFSVPEWWRAEKQKGGDGWYCPNGHPRVYRESDAAKAQRELQAEKDRHRVTLARLNQAESEKAAAKAKAAKLAKRAKHGVCPCCKRKFAQLARHMKSRHPDFA
jgi:DNA repair exonuclease SbcCD ATPase subunit